jgi:PAS domain-containing protein
MPIPRDAAPNVAELGAFVRRCRERMRPDELGIAPVGRRRTPGLRREELSLAAGVGLTWLTWLEQGRDIHVGDDALEALARTMHLSDDERTYLFALAGTRIPKEAVTVDAIPDRIRAIVDAIAFPACIITYRLDVPYLNPAAADLFLYGPDADVNCGRRVFFDADYRSLFDDVPTLERLAVGILRLAWSRHPDDRQLTILVDEIRSKSTTFAALWSERTVMHPVEQHLVHLTHPRHGAVAYQAQTLLLNEHADVSIYVAVPQSTSLTIGRPEVDRI